MAPLLRLRTATVTGLLLLLAAPLLSQEARPALRDRITTWRSAHEGAILRELADLLALPNVASDSAAVRANAVHLSGMLARRGIATRLLESPGSPPAVYGELRTPGATRTVTFYAHYDGQPVDSTRWTTPPWRPVLRSRALFEGGVEIPFPGPGEQVDPEARLYARSASDDKSPIVALLAALDALRALGLTPSVNLKIFLEGEEEAGSPHLRAMLERHRDLLAADLWLFADGPVHQSRRPQVVYGVRGVIGLGLTVYGPNRPLHSGHYGNFAPSPNVRLVHLLSSMRDTDGRITIAGFLDDVPPITEADRRAFASIPDIDDALRAEFGLARSEADNAPLAERLMLPALNIDGLQGGAVGAGHANVIQPVSHAAIDIRLVPGQRVARVRELVEAHIRSQGYTIVREDPDSATRARNDRLIRVDWSGGYPATRTPLDHPMARAVASTATEILGAPVVEVPLLGGSLPLFHFAEVLGAPLIVLPMVNHDNNQHGADENLRIANLWEGIVLYAGMLGRFEV